MVNAQSIRYVNKVDDSGWVTVQPKGTTSIADRLALCKYTKILLTENKDRRTYFKVLDGTHSGKIASMSEQNATLFFGTQAPTSSPLNLTITYGKYVEGWESKARRNQKINQQFATLTTQGLSITVTMNSVWGLSFTPLRPGHYAVLAPDVPHKGNMTTYYRTVAPTLIHDQVWFPIKYENNSRYIHVGNVSEGCATVVDLEKWVLLCEALVSHRSVDGKTVGQLVVTGVPERKI